MYCTLTVLLVLTPNLVGINWSCVTIADRSCSVWLSLGNVAREYMASYFEQVGQECFFSWKVLEGLIIVLTILHSIKWLR